MTELLLSGQPFTLD